jgi:hypothetical protein
VVLFDPSGLKVSSLLLLVLKLYSAVANKFVALAPIAKIPATAKTPREVNNDLYSLLLSSIEIK